MPGKEQSNETFELFYLTMIRADICNLRETLYGYLYDNILLCAVRMAFNKFLMDKLKKNSESACRRNMTGCQSYILSSCDSRYE